MIRHAMVPAVMTAHASTAAISATRMVGVPGHAWPVRQRARLMTHRSLNGGMRRPDRAAAMPGGEPGQPGRGGQAPADQQHHPDPGAVAGQERHPRACRPGHDPSPRAGPALRGRAVGPCEVTQPSARHGGFRM